MIKKIVIQIGVLTFTVKFCFGQPLGPVEVQSPKVTYTCAFHDLDFNLQSAFYSKAND
jgi:hypothetical protein